MFDCKNKLVLVTGASSGIGMETACAFARKGSRLVLTGRASGVLQDLRNRIQNDGGIAGCFPYDLNNISEIPVFVRKVEKHYEATIDILVNNAAVGVCGFVEDIPFKEHCEVLQVNYLASLALCHAVIPGMKAKGYGQIINITSGVGKRGVPLLSAICASKSALNALTESLRVELASYGIDVILFSPGLVDTQFNMRQKVYGNRVNQFSVGKVSSSSEIGKQIVDASIHRRREVTISMRAKLAHHLSYWFPYYLDGVFKRKIRSTN